MSEGPKWSVSFAILARWEWLPYFTPDDGESNYYFVKASWLCFDLALWVRK